MDARLFPHFPAPPDQDATVTRLELSLALSSSEPPLPPYTTDKRDATTVSGLLREAF